MYKKNQEYQVLGYANSVKLSNILGLLESSNIQNQVFKLEQIVSVKN